MPERKTVMISSTARDLPEHRKEAMDACLRQGMFPVMMEHLPASDDEAISASLAMVDAADIYVGIFAHRYGYVPAGHAISVTEMEYNRAVERKIPRLIFVMDKDHPITIDQVELGEGGVKLEAFKKRLLAGNIVNFFKSPADLRAQIINSLSQQREPDLATFHYVSDIPAPPEAYIAHPYTLLQTHRLIGRQAELNLLTDWVAGKRLGVSETPKVSIFNIVAIGGMGKSALDVEVVQRDRAAGDAAARRPDVVELLRKRRDLREFRHPGAGVRDRGRSRELQPRAGAGTIGVAPEPGGAFQPGRAAHAVF